MNLDFFRYIEEQENENSIEFGIDFNTLYISDNPMFEVYKKFAIFFNMNFDEVLDLKFYEKLKDIITKLVAVKPEERMTIFQAHFELNELKKYAQDFIFLNPLPKNKDDSAKSAEENTQISFALMDEISDTRLFTNSTYGIKLTQRTTNLCVSITAMRLLSYALVDFLEFDYNGEASALNDKKRSILKYPNVFIKELVTICCGVISPRSLNGLNHCKLDDDFKIAAQEQNIRE